MREPLTEYERGKMDGYQEGFEAGRERGFADGYSAGYEAANEELEAAMDEEDRAAIEDYQAEEAHEEELWHADGPHYDEDYSEAPSWDEYEGQDECIDDGYEEYLDDMGPAYEDEDPSHY
jgi:hypothetical protein